MEKRILEIKFRGIDTFNQPIYKVVGKKSYLGTNHKLFSWNESEEVVNKFFEEGDNIKLLLYFGNHFDCEPMGTPLKKEIELKIIK